MTQPPTKKDDSQNNEVTPWPERLQQSAAILYHTSRVLQDILQDTHRFALLTDQSDFDNKAVAAEIQEFNRLLVTALTALIDLTAYDNPEQEYPDLQAWFEFKCRNVIYGRQQTTFPPPVND